MKEKINENIELRMIDVKFEDINPKVMDIILDIKDKMNMKGTTLLSFTEGLDHLPIEIVFFKESEKVDDMYYTIRDCKYRKEWMDEMNEMYKKMLGVDFDNYINTIVYEENGYEIYRMLITTEKNFLMAAIAYPKEKENEVSNWQMMKRLKKYTV